MSVLVPTLFALPWVATGAAAQRSFEGPLGLGTRAVGRGKFFRLVCLVVVWLPSIFFDGGKFLRLVCLAAKFGCQAFFLHFLHSFLR